MLLADVEVMELENAQDHAEVVAKITDPLQTEEAKRVSSAWDLWVLVAKSVARILRKQGTSIAPLGVAMLIYQISATRWGRMD
jgi:hypothetical protein